jgi:hypothetical protein
MAKDRWRELVGEDIVWDVESAVSIGNNSIRLFIKYPLMDQQQETMRKKSLAEENVISRIKTSKTGIFVNCSSKQYAIFSITYLDEIGYPIDTVPISKKDIEYVYIEPSTSMETLGKDVCRYFKQKY